MKFEEISKHRNAVTFSSEGKSYRVHVGSLASNLEMLGAAGKSLQKLTMEHIVVHSPDDSELNLSWYATTKNDSKKNPITRRQKSEWITRIKQMRKNESVKYRSDEWKILKSALIELRMVRAQ